MAVQKLLEGEGVEKRLGKPSLFTILWCLLLLLITCSLGTGYLDLKLDDPFFTYRYATNLISGHGLVYNQGQRVLGVTSPLYTLVMAFVALFTSELPLASNLISLGCIGLNGICLFLMLRKGGLAVAALASSLLLVTTPLLYQCLGLETNLYLLLITLSFWAYWRQSYPLCGAFTGLAFLARADGALLAIILTCHSLWTKKSLPLLGLLTFFLVVFPWLLFSHQYYGSLFPQTLHAKMTQGKAFGTFSFLKFPSFFALNTYGFWRKTQFGLLMAFSLLGCLFCLFSRGLRILLILPLLSLSQALSYTVLRVPFFYHWYYALALFGALFTAGVGLEAVFREKRGALLKRAFATGLILCLCLMQVTATLSQKSRSREKKRANTYIEVSQWLKAHAPKGALVGVDEAGIIGYYSLDCHIIDLPGVITPRIRKNPLKDYLWPIVEYAPDYFLMNPVLIPGHKLWGNKALLWIKAHYQPLTTFPNPYSSTEPLLLLRKNTHPFPKTPS